MKAGLSFNKEHDRYVGSLEKIIDYGLYLMVSGWAIHPKMDSAAGDIVITDQNDHILAFTKPNIVRDDLKESLPDKSVGQPGWQAFISKNLLRNGVERLNAYVLDERYNEAFILRPDSSADLSMIWTDHTLDKRLATAVGFCKDYFDSFVWHSMFYLGVPILKCPFDLWIYQEIIYETQPDVIIETGTSYGGSALFLASLCETLGRGKVVTVDIAPKENRPRHHRINYVTGSSVSEAIVQKVKANIQGKDRVMVILDSDHSERHVLEEMQIYGSLVDVGSYMIVEDGIANGHPVLPDYGPGPLEAIEKFLEKDDRFVIDQSREKFLMTFNPKGYLKRVK